MEMRIDWSTEHLRFKRSHGISKWSRAILVAVLLVSLIHESAFGKEEPFTCEGYGLDSDVASLRQRFAGSIHTDNLENFILHFHNAQIGRDRISYIQFHRDRHGRVIRLLISYEVEAGLPKVGKRPRCKSVLQRLTRRYGPPDKREKPFYEESIRHNVVLWIRPHERMTLDCADREPSITIERRP